MHIVARIKFSSNLKNLSSAVGYYSYTNRYLQAEKKATARSSTFHFARTSQNKKSLPFPTTTHK
jgi:ribosomal protein L20